MIERAGKDSIGVQYPEGLDIITQYPKQILFGRELYPTIWLKAAFILYIANSDDSEKNMKLAADWLKTHSKKN